MMTMSIITSVCGLIAVWLSYAEYKKGKMSSRIFKIIAVCEGLAILGMIFSIING